MASNWDSTLVECTPDVISAIAVEARALLPFVFKQRLSIEAFEATQKENVWSLECVGFRRGVLGLEAPLAGAVSEALETLPIQVNAIAKRSANFALAVMASRVADSARWIFYSGSLCQSAGITLRQGIVESCSWADADQDPNYGRAAVIAAQALLPDVTHVDDGLFTAFYGQESRHRSIPVGV